MSMKHLVCDYEELEVTRQKGVVIDNKPIVIVLANTGEVYAYRDICPHRGPRLSLGAIDHTCSGEQVGEYIFNADKEVLRCPWHSWEFDIRTGKSLFNPDKVWVKSYEVTVEDGQIYIET